MFGQRFNRKLETPHASKNAKMREPVGSKNSQEVTLTRHNRSLIQGEEGKTPKGGLANAGCGARALRVEPLGKGA